MRCAHRYKCVYNNLMLLVSFSHFSDSYGGEAVLVHKVNGDKWTVVNYYKYYSYNLQVIINYIICMR